MRHLSRFLIGIRHKRIFRIRNVSGQLIDKVIELYPDKFKRVNIAESNEDLGLENFDRTITARFNKDDIIVEIIKTYDYEKSKYVEIDEEEAVNIAADSINVASEVLSLKSDYSRIGMIFDFSIPESEIDKGADSLGGFIKKRFINFDDNGMAGDGALVRFTYKMEVTEGLHIKKIKDFKNVIIRIEESSGINELGKKENGLLVHVDIQRIFDPSQSKIDVKEHYQFAKDHLNTTLIPQLQAKGVKISW